MTSPDAVIGAALVIEVELVRLMLVPIRVPVPVVTVDPELVISRSWVARRVSELVVNAPEEVIRTLVPLTDFVIDAVEPLEVIETSPAVE